MNGPKVVDVAQEIKSATFKAPSELLEACEGDKVTVIQGNSTTSGTIVKRTGLRIRMEVEGKLTWFDLKDVLRIDESPGNGPASLAPVIQETRLRSPSKCATLLDPKEGDLIYFVQGPNSLHGVVKKRSNMSLRVEVNGKLIWADIKKLSA